MKIHRGLAKRFKLSKPKRGKAKIVRQKKGMGSKHLKTKKSGERRRRLRQSTTLNSNSQNVKKAVRALKSR
jgi:ribosomal protein L35